MKQAYNGPLSKASLFRVLHEASEIGITAVAHLQRDFFLQVRRHPTSDHLARLRHAPAEASEGVLSCDGEKRQHAKEVGVVGGRELGQAVDHDLNEDGVEGWRREEEGKKCNVVGGGTRGDFEETPPVGVVDSAANETEEREVQTEGVEADVLDGDGEIGQVVLHGVVDHALKADL